MTQVRSTGRALALVLGTVFAASQAQAQPPAIHLPVPPAVVHANLPQLPPCFRDPQDAHAWIDRSYQVLKEIAHDRQVVDAYVVQLKIALAGQPEAVQADLQGQIDAYKAASEDLDLDYGITEGRIEDETKVPYCPPARRAEGPRIVVPLELGFSFFEGRRVHVFDNHDRTHTVIREEEGRRTVERLPNLFRR
jgi:hypothetical protein